MSDQSGRVQSPPEPDDVVNGHDPEIGWNTLRVTCYECQCGYRTYGRATRDQHLWLAHPASRNPDLTCQETAPWDHERWCIRAKGHEGDHWTPSFNGGMEWVNRG